MVRFAKRRIPSTFLAHSWNNNPPWFADARLPALSFPSLFTSPPRLLDAIYVAVWPWLLRASWRIYQKLPNNPSGRTVYIKANPHGSLLLGFVVQSKTSMNHSFTAASSILDTKRVPDDFLKTLNLLLLHIYMHIISLLCILYVYKLISCFSCKAQNLFT